MSPPPGFVVRGCWRAFLAAGNREVTAAELFAWCYATRAAQARALIGAGWRSEFRPQERLSDDPQGCCETSLFAA